MKKIIQVTKPTATIDNVPPIASWASKLKPFGPYVSAAPAPSDTSTAMATPAPHHRQHLPAIGADEVGDEDADDQRCFEAFAQTDQEVREHGRSARDPHVVHH